jgi:hypothetical protein
VDENPGIAASASTGRARPEDGIPGDLEAVANIIPNDLGASVAARYLLCAWFARSRPAESG